LGRRKREKRGKRGEKRVRVTEHLQIVIRLVRKGLRSVSGKKKPRRKYTLQTNLVHIRQKSLKKQRKGVTEEIVRTAMGSR